MSADNRFDTEHTGHVTEEEVAAFLAGDLGVEARATVERHLARCAECRDEVVAVHEILVPEKDARTIPWRVLAPAAAAATILFVVAGPLRDRLAESEPQHRDVPSQVMEVPTPVFPIGAVERADHLAWRMLARSDQYRVTLFAEDATVLWRTTTSDTVAEIPDSVQVSSGRRYLWRLEARVGWDVWEESDLVEFTVGPVDPLP